jgi:transcriptional regulator with XRE-family HTH domain
VGRKARQTTPATSEWSWPPPGSSGCAQAVSTEGSATVGELFRRARLHHRLTLRDVEDRTDIPNAHLSQIERGVIRKPNPTLLLTLCDLYDLNYELVATWAGYLDETASDGDDRMLQAAMRSFARLDVVTQRDVLKQLEELEMTRRGRHTDA